MSKIITFNKPAEKPSNPADLWEGSPLTILRNSGGVTGSKKKDLRLLIYVSMP
jgi:hypothetical protein